MAWMGKIFSFNLFQIRNVMETSDLLTKGAYQTIRTSRTRYEPVMNISCFAPKQTEE